MSRISKSIVVSGYHGLGEGRRWNGEFVSNEYKALVWDDEIVLGMVSGDGCMTMGMHLVPLNCILQNT